MNDLEKRTLDTLKRVRDFDAAHANLFPAGSLARELFDNIGGVIHDLEGYASAEVAGRGAAKQGTASKAAAKAGIIEDLSVLRRTARSMAVVIPGVEEHFPIPHKQDGQELVNTARAATAAAETFKAEFLRREVPERLFMELAANITAYEAALTGQNTGKDERVMAAGLIDAAINRGVEALRELDPIVRNKLHDNPATLTAWLSAKRIERPSRRNINNTPPTPNT